MPLGMPGHRWRIVVTTVALSCAGAAAALAQPVESAPPTISGKAVYDATLRCNPGTWAGAVRFTYTWNNGGQVLGTAQTLQVPVSAIDYQITCTATAYDATGAVASATSAAVVAQPATPSVRITKASAARGVVTISGTISPRAAVSGTGAQVILTRYLGRTQGSLQLTFGGLLHHHTRFTLRARDTARGHRTYAVEFNQYSQGFVPQVIVFKRLTVR